MKKHYWIINLSDRDVMLRDLGISIPRSSVWDLLQKKRFYFTREQLEKSAKSGSLYKKRDMIMICKEKPEINDELILIISEND
jgi:hypothetical protein